MVCCGPATSSACRPPSMWTITLVVRASSLRRVVVQIGGVGQAPGILLDLVQVGEVLRRGDDGDFNVLALGALAHREHLHAVRSRRQRVEVPDRVFVIGQIEIVAGIVAENGNRRGDLRSRTWKAPG